MKLTPASRAARQTCADVASSESPPNDIAPSATLETMTPVLPRVRNTRLAVERGCDPREHLLLGSRDAADAEEAAGGARDHLREADDLVLEQAVLLVVELRGQRLDVRLPRLEQLVARALREPRLQQVVAGRALLEALAMRALQDRGALVVLNLAVGPRDLDQRDERERGDRLRRHAEVA